MQEDLDSSQYHRGACMFETIFQEIHNIEHFVFISRVKLRSQVKNNTLTPLIEILNSVQQMNHQWPLNINAAFIGFYLIYSFNSIDHYKGIVISSQLIEIVQEISL